MVGGGQGKWGSRPKKGPRFQGAEGPWPLGSTGTCSDPCQAAAARVWPQVSPALGPHGFSNRKRQPPFQSGCARAAVFFVFVSIKESHRD